MARIGVLVVDDSPVVRSALTRALDDDHIRVVGSAENPVEAVARIAELRPDVLTLDVEMPGMDGLTFLRQLMRTDPRPVVLVSSMARRSQALVDDALAAGALAVLPKPHGEYTLPRMLDDLRRAVRQAPAWRAREGAEPIDEPAGGYGPKVVAVGSSTGGTTAFERFAAGFPASHPCIVLAQHLPVDFVPRFAERLDHALRRSRVAVAAGGEVLQPGHVYVAPATHHLKVKRDGARLVTELWDGPQVNFHKPSVDVLLESVATACRRNAIGVILTGMGADGAAGLLAMRRAGAPTLVQDESTSAVYGMPRAAWELGAAREQLPLEELAPRVLALLTAPRREPVGAR